ncbi:endoplasmic reticulum metallopeptidase 1-like [Lucilia cuprina]|uniref:endoplasmic reticulum metallopeptidase 1-like n=1 Tax=Lucilia cuprina TaxID=7375 RepID=UPI001F06C6C7|nr:endoplasmic reticulum metallopeptidase 1-like [Lucilia cuprina]
MSLLDGGYIDCRRQTGGQKIIFDSVYSKRNVHHIWEGWSFVVLGVLILLGYTCRYNLHENLPKALGNSDLLYNPHSFIAERAWKDLKILTNFGPRVVGSYSNEVLAVDFLKREISYIKQLAHKNQRIELDVQVVSGTYWTGFKPYGMTTMYRNIQNVVVKLHGEYKLNQGHQNTNFKDKALLLNCHFDTVPGSPGASDDAANCVVMLEILRVLSRSEKRLKHSIIFLFNGAEETGLQASHGFITKHKWAPEIKAFINLESVGSGGKELLFQNNRNNSWLMQMYADSVPYPSAQVAAEEIFDSGLIPSDTDYRIFSNFRGLPGLDFAHIINGQRYHTKFDSLDYLPNGSIQHTGCNILELTKAIADSDEFGIVQPAFDGSSVYYDIFGIYFVTYSVDFATVFNYIIVICSVLLPYIVLSRATKGINKKHLRYEIFLGFLIKTISLVTSCACCYAIAYDLDVMGKPMTWYSNTFLCIPTYCLVTIFVQSIAHLIFNRNQKTPLSLALQTQARLIGTSFFWGILSAALTGAGIRTAYALIVPLLITLLANLIIGILKFENTIRRWLYIHLAGQVLVALWTLNFYNMVVDVFISTAGRSGGKKNPDVMVAIICSTFTFFTTSYLTPLVILFKKCKNFLVILFATYIITRFYFISFTHYGFPYRDDKSGDPRVQRHYITHSIRTLYDKQGDLRYTDSGFWFQEMDRNARKTIESLTMPEEPIPQDENILCKSEVFCGLPLLSARQLLPGGFWVPGPAPVVREIGHFKLVLHEKLTTGRHRMHFMITGNYLMSLNIRPKESVTLESWNLTPRLPPETVFNKQKCYFVMITHGLEHETINITLTLKTADEDFKRSLIDVTLVTAHFEHNKEHTSIFANLLGKLPSWTYAVPSVASLKSWTF